MYLLATLFWWIIYGATAQTGSLEPAYYHLTWQEFSDLSAVQKIIPLKQPDYQLLDAAIFHITNKIRAQEGKPPLQYLPALHQSAAFHAQAMIDLEFYNHYNLKQLAYLTPDKRIIAFGGFFHYTAENIAQYDIINTDLEYCPARQPNNSFNYLNCHTLRPYRAYTYLAYAEVVVAGWLHSPPHRKSLLSTDYQYVGCAARISKNPYQQRQVPFARPVQNFGGYGTPDPPSLPVKENATN